MIVRLLGMGLLSAVLLSSCTAKQPEDHNQHNAASSGNEQGQHAGHGTAEPAPSMNVKATWKLSADNPPSNQKANISIQIDDSKGVPVEKFEVNHEKQLHLILVSKDLSYFDHIHPEYMGKGLFEISTIFPKDGDYKLIADFVPTGTQQKTESHWIQVGNDKAPIESITPDSSLTKTVDNKEITLQFDKLQAGKEVQMNFSFTDSKTKSPITNLQPYLGAVGHVVIISSDVEQYIHNHPLEEKATGPDAKFATSFPKSGVYKIWGQFQQNGQLFIVPFVVQVP
ncbi:hypothetical protein [Paenibacillus agricola]|uniref:Secreted protein n=1 Tax=Paenibacillus agricola TaxID=2716264 RepID=A0ABX0J0A5_9BACL|nr:hypothetical protein [Paenibacillus agricola]NHN28213.1 hypothetical protein [Paenibacillus agricola]